jgi:hypothetical protein
LAAHPAMLPRLAPPSPPYAPRVSPYGGHRNGNPYNPRSPYGT